MNRKVPGLLPRRFFQILPSPRQVRLGLLAFLLIAPYPNASRSIDCTIGELLYLSIADTDVIGWEGAVSESGRPRWLNSEEETAAAGG